MRNTSTFKHLLLLASLLTMAGNAFAWGQAGHKIVGDLAESQLTVEAKAQVMQLLAGDLSANGTPSGRKTLGEVASWADEIKKAQPKVKPWHYDDLPLCGAPVPEKVCPQGNCASVQLARFIGILKDGRQPARDRNEALKWVVHLIGDIHQPLHATDNGDVGGNGVVVSFFGKTTNQYGDLNLHAIWDEDIVVKLVSEKGGQAAFVEMPYTAEQLSQYQAGTVRDWISESHGYAVATIYPKLPIVPACNASVSVREDLGQEYYDLAAPIAELQLRRAGVRLAAVLNIALAKDGPELRESNLTLAAIAPHLAPAPHLPDPAKTPERASYNSVSTVCNMPTTRDIRSVDEAAKTRIYESYGVAKCQGYCSGKEGCEVDHLISLELGGANTEDNLWPQPYEGEWNAHDKDRLENRLKAMVCKEKSISLADAQREISNDWISAYKKYIGARKPFNGVAHCK